MMKKQISSLVLAGALLLGTAAPLTANAAKVSTTGGTTDSTVQFDAPDNTTQPVDPTDPSTQVPTNPDDNGGAEPVGGNLTFLYVSPTISFGEHKTLTTGTQTIENTDTDTPIKVTSRAFSDGGAANTNLVTEISDTRGTNAGWNVQVTSSALANGDNQLTGAFINLNAADTTKNTIKNSADNTGISGSDQKLATSGDTSTSGETATPIYTATAGNGAGQTAFQLSPDNISMTDIPANVVAGTYTGTLTWTLNDSPAN